MGDVLGKVVKAGFGKQGYCKLCSLSDPQTQDELDKRVGMTKGEGKDGKLLYVYTPKALNAWLAGKIIDFKPVNRQTFYSHREHVMHPQDRTVMTIKKRQLEHGSQPAQFSDEAVLDSLIAMGHQNALVDPDSVSIDHVIKAIGIKQSAKSKGDAHQTLVAIFTGNYDPDGAIEGEAKEV